MTRISPALGHQSPQLLGERSMTSPAQEDLTAPSGKAGGSLLAPYGEQLFLEHPTWRSLLRILQARGGGSYGLSGPRGAGKTWMMEKARRWAKQGKGLGVWFPSPSEYEAMAFLGAISDVVASHYEAYYDDLTGRPTRASRRRYLLVSTTGLMLIYAAAAILFAGFTGFLDFTQLSPYTFVAIALFVPGALLFRNAISRRRADQEGLGRIRRAAEELRLQVRYIVTTKESSEIGAEGGRGGLTARLKRARERELVERPATLSSLIQNFRAFVELMAAGIDGPVVIAIDELDKMSDAARVSQLLRDIKGIFDIPGAYFLVSLSDEAARALGLGAVRTRNEFNSSFYAVVPLPPLTPEQCLAMLRQRATDFDKPTGLAIGVMTGGVPREIVRVAERVQDSPSLSPERAVRIAMEEELDAFTYQVLATADPQKNAAADIRDGERLALFDSVEGARSGLRGNPSRLCSLLIDAWDLNAGCESWRLQFQEEWRRVLVRLGVAALIMEQPARLLDAHEIAELQETVKLAARSAAVARAQFAGLLIRAMTRTLAPDGQPDDQQTLLALFLLSRGAASFRTAEYVAAAAGPNGHRPAVLQDFRRRGILQRSRSGIGWTWSLTPDASGRLLGAS
jgi:hypothetical protein